MKYIDSSDNYATRLLPFNIPVTGIVLNGENIDNLIYNNDDTHIYKDGIYFTNNIFIKQTLKKQDIDMENLNDFTTGYRLYKMVLKANEIDDIYFKFHTYAQNGSDTIEAKLLIKKNTVFSSTNMVFGYSFKPTKNSDNMFSVTGKSGDTPSTNDPNKQFETKRYFF